MGVPWSSPYVRSRRTLFDFLELPCEYGRIPKIIKIIFAWEVYFHSGLGCFMHGTDMYPDMNWEHHFNRARGSILPVTVNKQEVGGIPYGFEAQSVTIDGVYGVYERHDGFGKIRITEVAGQYIVSVSDRAANNPKLQQAANIGDNKLQPRSTGSQNGVGKKGLATLGLAIGAGAIAAGKAISDSESPSIPDPKQGHRVFISHSWRYEDHYEQVKSLLDNADRFEYFDHSVSSEDPIDAQLPNHLRSKIRDQMQSTSVFLVLAGMYVAHSDWIQEEIEMAADMEKPVIGVVPGENDKVPNIVEEHATELVETDGNQILDAIERHT